MLARIAQHMVSPEAHQRVLLPLLADYQHELGRTVGPVARARVRLGWLVAFWWSLAVEGMRAGRLHLARNAWGTTEDERNTTRVLLRCLLLSVAWLVLLIVLSCSLRGAPDRTGTQLLLPGIIGFVLPVACLFAILLAAQLRGSAGLRLRPLVGVTALGGVLVFANLAWITPEANYAYKRAAWREHSRLHPELRVGVFRGDREMSVNALLEQAADLRDRSRFAEVAHLELELHKRPALGAWCLAFALAGAALVRRIRGGVLGWGMALAIGWIWCLVLRLGEQAADAGRVPPAVAMWMPVLAVTFLAMPALWRPRTPRASLTQPPSPR
jgi:hypothetical protein